MLPSPHTYTLPVWHFCLFPAILLPCNINQDLYDLRRDRDLSSTRPLPWWPSLNSTFKGCLRGNVMAKNKSSNGNVITDAVIDELNRLIQDIRSKYPRPIAYDVIRSHPDLERCRINLIYEYFSVVDEIEKDKKPSKKVRPKVRQDYLKRLLSPLIKLNRLHPSGENPYRKFDGTYPFIEEKIWIDREIDFKKCHYDKKKYSINFEDSKPLEWFDPDAKNITIWNEYQAYMTKKKEKDAKRKAMSLAERFRSTSAPAPLSTLDEGKTSVYEHYKKWLPELTQKKIKSEDLLDQILVCYTIKRALNGDKKAIDKLYSLYKDAAIGIAVKMAKKRKLNISEINEIKQEARISLNLLISGLEPEYIIDSLLKEDSEHSKIPLWVEIFFFWYFSDHVPKEFDKMKQKPSGWGEFEVDYLLNPIAIIDAYTFWQNSPILVRKFNSSSFRPFKKTNLTTWLFGTKTNYKNGKFCQLISDVIDSYWEMKKKGSFQKLCKDDLLYDELSNNRGKKLENSLEKQRHDMTDEEIEQVIKDICKKGISKRDAEIFVKNKVQKCSKVKLAQEYDLSRMTIHRICKNILKIYTSTV